MSEEQKPQPVAACARCVSYQAPSDESERGLCRFLPPVPFPIRLLDPVEPPREPERIIPGLGRVTVNKQPRPETFAGFGAAFPIVAPDAWCRQFEPKPEPVP